MNFWVDIKKMYYSEFFKYSAALLSSNAISQLIAIVTYPFLTRIYGPVIFGEFMLFLTIVSILSIMPTGRYESAIVLPKSEKKAAAIFQLCLILNLLFFILSFFIISIWKNGIASLFDWEQLAGLLPLIPFFVLVSGCWQTLSYYFVRQKRYYNISIYNVSQSIINSGLKYLFGLKGFMQSGLIWGHFLGQFVAASVSLIAGKSALKGIKKVEKAEIVYVAKRYSNFPKFVLPQDLLNTVAGNLPILLLAVYFDMKDIGIFSLALTLGLRPVTLFGNSVYQVFLRKMSERLQNKEKLLHECLLFCKMCLIIILPVFVLFAFIPGKAFGMLFGEEWESIGFYLKLLLPCLFLSILVASFSFIPDIFFRQKTSLHIEIIYLILKVISLFVGIYFKNFNWAIISYCCTVTFMLTLKLVWYYRLIRKYELSL